MRRVPLSWLYLILLAGASSLLLFCWPIQRLDTDLWFHLSHGRYLFEHGRVPHDTFFSFLSPPRTGVVYAWLFQAVLYQGYRWWGDYGPLALRALVFLATALLVIKFLLQDAGARSPRVYLSVLCGLIILLLQPRFFLVRPHMMTYLFMILFLYIIELKPQGMWWLPLLAVLWCNSHGIAYPLLVLIALSYSIEYLVGRHAGATHAPARERGYFVPLVLSLVAVYFTPHSAQLLTEPFKSLTYVSTYVSEFAPIRWADLSSFAVTGLAPSHGTLLSLLVALAVAAGLPALAARRARISHLVLCAGAGVLLLRGNRFMYEASLLVLPLLKANPPVTPGALARAVPRSLYVALLGLLMVMPFVGLSRMVGARPRYPFSARGLPRGVARFLLAVDVGGTVLSYPDSTGYLRWMIYPRYRIFMDLESNLFTAEDFYIGINAFTNGAVLQEVLRRYDPSFISAPIQQARFPSLIHACPDYVPVFFDDAEVLYVNARRHSAIAQRYALSFDPFQLFTQPLEEALAAAERPRILAHMRQLLDIDPDGGSTNHWMASFWNREGAYDRAIPYARVLIEQYPEWHRGYEVLGDALKGLQAYDRALSAYRQALRRADTRANKHNVLMQIGIIYFEQRRYRRAYRAFVEAVDLFSPEASLEDVYRLGSAALLAGKPREAQAILAFLYQYRMDPGDAAFAASVRENLHQLGIVVEEPTALQR